MRPQSAEPTGSHDLLAAYLGPNAYVPWCMFKKYFRIQDPTTMPPERKKCPKHKCDSTFCWFRHIIKAVWVVCKTCGANEQTCPMRAISEFKTRCGKFKRIGGGIQADCLADDGYTFAFYFQNKPVDTKWLEMGLSPLYSRLMHMFSQLDGDRHECTMDNL